ncbi:MAG: NAD-dependent epimerase/dehydratase family protein [Armatimonadota bacterium]
MRVLLTGAAGYAGSGIGAVLQQTHWVRGLDIRDAGTAANESVVGDIADLDVCRQAISGIDAVVLCHMAPNPVGYQTPVMAIDVNVKGTANLYHHAVEAGIRRFVLISSTGVLLKEPGATAVPGDGPYHYHYNFYVLTKIMQEDTARYYHEMHGIATLILRPGWVVYDKEGYLTKYGQPMTGYDPGLIDPRDIGAAVTAALALPAPGLEAFQIGQEDSGLDLTEAHRRLSWNPQYRFDGLRQE